MRAIPKFWKQKVAGFNPWVKASDYYFDVAVAERVIEFIETEIKHSKGKFAGKLFILEPWQKQAVGHLFGWKQKTDGTRRFRKLFVYVPRKNGKTTLLAAVGIILLSADGEPGAEVYSAAADRDQANLIFKEASNMVTQNRVLSSEIIILDGYKVMKHELSMSYWKVLTSEAGTKHGLNPHGYMVDELHAQKNNELVEVLETGVGSRTQPVGIYITTADYAKESPCNTMYAYAKKVRDGIVKDPQFLPVIYDTTEGKDDWRKEAVWRRVNPNLGVSIPIEFLRSQYQKALNEPSFENPFKRLHLNMQTKQEMAWLNINDWDSSGQKIKAEDLKGKLCFAAVDLSSTSDISALVLYFPECFSCLCYFWVPAKTAKDKIEYGLWEKQGYVEIAGEKTIDYGAIEDKILELAKDYSIPYIAYDPWNASQFAIKMSNVHGFTMVEFRQGFLSMNEPAKELEKMIVGKILVHFSNPVLRWMASNVNIKQDSAGNIKPVKASVNSPLKIDGIIALIMAVGISISKNIIEADSFVNLDDDNFDSLMEEIYG